MATIRDVARLANVSVTTVSNVINSPDKVSAELLARVQAAIDKLGYAPHAAARSLLASDLIPNTLDILDHAAAAALGLVGEPALVVGFDGLGEQVDWQVAELSALVASLGGGEVTTLPPAAWSRLATAAHDAIASRRSTARRSVPSG